MNSERHEEAILSAQGSSLTRHLTWPLCMSLGNFFPLAAVLNSRFPHCSPSAVVYYYSVPQCHFPSTQVPQKRERSRPFPAINSYETSWKKTVKVKQMGTSWKQSNPRGEKHNFWFCKDDLFVSLNKDRWEDKNKLITTRVTPKKNLYHQDYNPLLACCIWTERGLLPDQDSQHLYL